MAYTNMDIFVFSANGCMSTAPDGLESILAGNEEGAKGCCLTVDMTADGIAVLSENGYCIEENGTRMAISEFSYAELHEIDRQLIPAGQAIELAKTCRAKIALFVRNQTLLPQLRMTLRHADYLDECVFVGLGLVEAARLAVANPDLHIMGELPALPDNIGALISAVQTTGLFGVRAQATDLTPQLIAACRTAGLFTMSQPSDEIEVLQYLTKAGVNFIETARPDLACTLLPAEDVRPTPIPLYPL